MVKASTELTWAFAALALLVAAAFPVLVYRSARTTGDVDAPRRAAVSAALTALWLAATFALAASGRLRFDTLPPTMLPLMLVAWGLAFRVGLSRTGARLAEGLPLAVLVGVQGFRLPLELLMHRAYSEGLMPVQMSFSGRNFDIVTGTTALLLAAWLAAARGRVPLRVVAAWNVVGTLLLLNVLVVALLSAPTPLRVFVSEPANVWITRAPWVWLPAVFVPAAIAGHVVVFRRLRREAAARRAHHPPAVEERRFAGAGV